MNDDILMPIPSGFEQWKRSLLLQIQRINILYFRQSVGYEPPFKNNRDVMQEYLTYLSEYVRNGWAKDEDEKGE